MDLKIIADLRKSLIEQGNAYPTEIPVTTEKVFIAGVPCHWLQTPNTNNEKLIFYLHGGSNVMGSFETHRHLIARIADNCKVQALAIDYSLAPEHPFPQGFLDIKGVYQKVIESYSPEDIVVMGDSAGGQQGMALLLECKKENIALPAAYVGLSPALDISPDTIIQDINRIAGKDVVLTNADEVNPFLALYYQNHSPKNPQISPLYGALDGLPPSFILVSSDEALVFQCREFAQKAQAAGSLVTIKEYPEMMHVWMFFKPTLPESQQALNQIAKFTRKHLQ